MTEKVSKEAIEQALQTLGLVDQPDLSKADDADDNQEAQPSAEELAKAKQVEDIIAKAKELGFNLVKAEDGGAPATACPDLGSAANGGTVSPQSMPQVGRKEIEALGTLLKAQKEENDELRKSVDSISEFNVRLAEKLNMIEKQPMDRKSISTAKYLEKDFAKGGDGAAPAAGEKTLSLANPTHRAHLVDTMFDAAVKDGAVKDKELEKAIEYVEITKSLGNDPRFSQRIQQRLKNEFKINLVR